MKLNKAEREMLRFAALDRIVGTTTNTLAISPVKTKGNAAKRATVERLRELGLVKGVRLTDEGFAIGKAEHERVEATRRAHLTK
jgi:hypothetical protein